MKLPTLSLLKCYLFWSVILTFLFLLIYGETNYLASQNLNSYEFGFNFERSIPFWAPSILIYSTLNILFLLPLFKLKEEEIHRLGQSIAVSLLIGAFFFYFLPAKTLHQRNLPEGYWRPMYEFLYSWDKPYNTFPSLHVSFSFLLVCFLQRKSERGWIYWLWFGLICLSVLFTHQHHLADILAGTLLGLLVWNLRKI